MPHPSLLQKADGPFNVVVGADREKLRGHQVCDFHEKLGGSEIIFARIILCRKRWMLR
jgi:hypothetical protein